MEGRRPWREFVAKDEERQRIREWGCGPVEGLGAREFTCQDRFHEEKDVLVSVATMPGTRRRLAAVREILERKRAEQW